MSVDLDWYRRALRGEFGFALTRRMESVGVDKLIHELEQRKEVCDECSE